MHYNSVSVHIKFTNEVRMILNPFNLVYFGFLIFVIAIIVALTLVFKKKDEKVRKQLILGICFFNIVFYVIYKILLYVRTPGLPDTYTYISLKELPLHLCNISLILAPLSIFLKNKNLMSFCFFVSPLGAFFAMTFPSDGFYNCSIFNAHMIGFYGTHAIIIIVGMLLVTLGFYSPSFRQIPRFVLFFLILSLSIFVVNVLIFQITGVRANYFFTVMPEGISILELFWSWLPVPYLYLSFAIVILLAYIAIIMTPITIIRKKRANTVNTVDTVNTVNTVKSD